jgi:16S rRNA C1402 (ribose-2'-O) methylase RsmI
MDRHARRFPNRHEPRHDRFRIAVQLGDDLAMEIGRQAAHIVMNGRQHRDRLARHVDTGKDACGLADAGQPLMQDVGAKMLQVQLDIVL